WRDLPDLPHAERLARLSDAKLREQLRWGLDHPNTDSKQGSTLPPPALDRVFVDRSAARPDAVGKSLAQLAQERRGDPADGMFDPTRIGLGKRQLVRDRPGGEERWQVRPEGIVRVIVNGKTIVADGQLTRERPGRVLKIGTAPS